MQIASTINRPRILVTLASFGDKNLDHLKRIIEAYNGMPFDVDIVVVSNAPKDLGPSVSVRVGLPTDNPWSLPFAHKQVFAENADKYDLFIYSEDDMEVSAENITAFLELSPCLGDDEIAGFLRYEVDSSGARSLPEIHGAFHWKAESTRKRESHTVAEFSNEHAAFYILTQKQLKTCIASGGFLCPPHEGRYDMLCAAATDPYTQCGFRKVICISSLDRFLIHHRPNRYAGHLGISYADCMQQVAILLRTISFEIPAYSLGIGESILKNSRWSKGYYESPSISLLASIPSSVQTLLSIGCGHGATEQALSQRGINVSAIPLDSIIGTVAQERGIKIIHGNLHDGIEKLRQQTFDAVLISDILHLVERPTELLAKCAGLLRSEGILIATGPNFMQASLRIRRALNRPDALRLFDQKTSGINAFSLRQLNSWLHTAGLIPARPVWLYPSIAGTLSGAHSRWQHLQRSIKRTVLQFRGGSATAESWLVQARKP